MRTENIFLMGAPQSGKTSYLALALGYLLRLNGTGNEQYTGPVSYLTNLVGITKGQYSIMFKGNDQNASMYTNEIPDAMRRGKWPEKTGTHTLPVDISVYHTRSIPALGPTEDSQQPTNPWREAGKFFLKYELTGGFEIIKRAYMSMDQERLIHFTDCAGEVFEPSHEMDEQAKADFLKYSQASDYFILFFDAQVIRDELPQENKVIECCNALLEQRCKEFVQETHSKENKQDSPERLRVAIVLTKCDAVEELYPSDDDSHPWDDKAIIDEFKSRYISRLSVIGYMRKKGILDCEYFCVSCLPNPEHRNVNKTQGIVANGKWSLDDMKDQIGPLRWISEGFLASYPE